MTETPVMIALVSSARYEPDEAAEPIRTMTSGTLTVDGNKRILKYTETLQDDQGGTASRDVTMEISPSRVTMQSVGTYGMTLVFQRGLHYDGIYHTPFGDMPISVLTTALRVEQKDRRGALHITYQMAPQGAFSSTIDLELTWRARTVS